MRVSQSQKSPLSSALQRLEHGRYYAARTEEVLGKAESALDGFVGSAMNIMHDTVERDVSRRGDELSAKVRRGQRYIKRGEVNQSAYNGALSDATSSLAQAAAEESSAALTDCLERLKKLAADQSVESAIGGVKARLADQAQPRLDEVSQDAVGRDVHHHGRPIWDHFETAMTSLEATGGLASSEGEQLEALIADLKTLEG